MPRKWSEADDKIVLDGYERGDPTRIIAAAVGKGVTHKMVIGRANRLGFRHRYPRSGGRPVKAAA